MLYLLGPDYEAQVVDTFSKLLRMKPSRGRQSQDDLIYRGSRAVFWSTDNQRIMDEHQIEEVKELRDCAVVKFPIVDFGQQGSKISSLYDNVKLLVFCTDPWKLIGTQAVAINEKIMYALVKCTYKGDEDREPEYLIIAEKRIGEFLARGSSFYVTPGGKKESIDLKTLMLMHGEQLKTMILKNPLVPTND